MGICVAGAAHESTHYGCLFAQVVIEFEEVFWPDVDFLGAVTNKPADCSYFLNVHRSLPAPSGASAVES